MTTATLTNVNKKMSSHLETVEPGRPFTISAAADVGDGVWQGDLGIELIAKIPSGYTELKRKRTLDQQKQRPASALFQLVPGNTEGAKHVINDLGDAKVFLPSGWGEAYEGLDGPVIATGADPVTIDHPKHGAVTCPPNRIFKVRYQQEWSKEEQRERRARD